MTDDPLLRSRAFSLLREHAGRYPLWCVVDVYKLLFQACMGPAHASAPPDTLLWRLREEWESVAPAPRAPLVEHVGVHHPLWRIHLAAAKGRGMGLPEVFERFLHCIRVFPPRPELLPPLWEAACTWIRTQRVPVADPQCVSRVDADLRSAGFPPVGHSAPFRTAYAPSYRLVCCDDPLAEWGENPSARGAPSRLTPQQ